MPKPDQITSGFKLVQFQCPNPLYNRFKEVCESNSSQISSTLRHMMSVVVKDEIDNTRRYRLNKLKETHDTVNSRTGGPTGGTTGEE